MSESQNKIMGSRRRIPRQSAPTSYEDDDSVNRAESEKQNLEKKRSEHYRDQVSRKILAWGIWILIIVIFVIVVGAVFTLGYHHIFPNKWHWLGKDELQDIKNLVLSGAVVGLGTTYIRRYLEES